MDIVPEKVIEIFMPGFGWIGVKKGNFKLTNNFNNSPGYSAMSGTGIIKDHLEHVIMVREEDE